MSVLSILASVLGMSMAFSNIPQAHKIFKRKSAGDISPITYTMLTAGSLVWLLYGIELGNLPIILTYSVGTLSCILVLAGWIKHK